MTNVELLTMRLARPDESIELLASVAAVAEKFRSVLEEAQPPLFRRREHVRVQTCANWLAIDFAARVVCSSNDVLEQIRDLGE